MRHLRPFTAFLAFAAIAVACSSTPGASSGGEQSQGSQASDGSGGGGGGSSPAGSTGGGGGGGGGGQNGSAHYDITGDVTKSGDASFVNSAGVSQFVNDGWVAYFNDTGSSVVLQISSVSSQFTVGYGDGEITIVGAQSTECSFDFSRNDSGGLKGTIDCPNPTAFNSTTAAQVHIHLRVTIDAHT